MTVGHSRLRLTRLAPSIAAAVGVALLAGCSGISGGSPSQPPAAPAGARSGGVLKVGVTPPAGLEPLAAYESVGKMIVSAMCDTLVTLDPVTGQVREGLTRGWVLAPDGRSITFKLRKGLTFSNGRKVTSKDINLSLVQLIAAGNASPLAGLAGPYSAAQTFGRSDSSVLADADDQQKEVSSSISKSDAQVNAILKDTGAGRMRAFAEPGMSIIDDTVRSSDSNAFANNPVCVGPYKLAKPYVPGDKSLTLTRTSNYYGKNVGYTSGGVGYPDEIELDVFATADDVVSAYLSGKVDVVQVPKEELKRVASQSSSLVFGAANTVEYLGLPDGGQNVLNDAVVRQALSLALDRTALASSFYGATGQPANSFVPPALAISEGPSLEGETERAAPVPTCATTIPATAQAAKAKTLLGTRLSKGAITLTVNDDAPFPQLAAAIASQWQRNLGIKVQIKTMPWLTYSALAAQGQGFDSAFRIRWSTDAAAPSARFNDAQDFITPLLSSGASGTSNWAHWSNRDFDFALTKVIARTADVQQRGIALNAMSLVLCQQMPLLPLVFERPTFLIRQSKVGMAREVPVSRNGVLMLRELYLKK